MAAALKQWKQRFDQTPLPILSHTAHHFSKQRSRPGACISTLWDSLRFDPGMCLNLLRIAGRSKYTQVTTMTHAILLIGLPNALEQARNLPRLEEMKNSEQRRLLLHHYHNAFHGYLQSEDWAMNRNHEHSEQLATASLNTQFIDYLLCCSDPECYDKLIKTQRQGIDKHQAEKKVLGVLKRELAHEIAHQWHLPELIIESQSHGSHPQTNAQHVYLAQRLAEAANDGWYHEEMEDVLQDVSEYLHQPLEKVVKRVHHTAVEATRQCDSLYQPVTGVAVRLNEHPPAQILNPPVPINSKTSRKDILKDCIMQLESKQPLDYRKILNLSFKGIRDGLGLQRAFFALLDSDKHHLSVKYAIDIAGREGLQSFRLPLNKNTLFEQLMRLPGALWMNDSNRKRYQSFLPKVFMEQIRSDAFFAMSIFIHEKPIAMFFADGCKSGNLTENQFKYFKKICTSASMALTRVSDQNDNIEVANG